MAYSHTNIKGGTYYLHSKDVTLEEENQTIYFSKREGSTHVTYLQVRKLLKMKELDYLLKEGLINFIND